MSNTTFRKQGTNMQQTTENTRNGNRNRQTESAPAAASSAATATTDAPATSAPAGTAEQTEKKERTGKPPQMPAVAVYHLGGRVYAGVFNPVNQTKYIESGKGEGSAVGALVDSGFKITELTNEGPQWLQAMLPEGATNVQFAGIRSFPLPKQD